MSSHFTPSFSSAAQASKDAAGASNQPGATAAGSGPGSGGGAAADWTRRANGASTASSSANSHRRPSLSTTLTHPNTPSHPLASSSSSSSNVYHPPHHFNRTGTNGGTSYDKDTLLSIYKSQESSGTLGKKLEDLVLLPEAANGPTGRAGAGWGRNADESSQPGAEVCWDKEGHQKPVSLEDMTEEERELFAIGVNSPHKMPPSNAVNHGTPPQNRTGKPSAVGAPPGSTRPPARRRETSDAAQGGNPFGIGATPPQLARRRTDLREGDEKEGGSSGGRTFFGRWGTAPDDDHAKDKDEPPLSAGGIRSTGLFRRGSAAWGSGSGSGFSSSALNSPMGTFGNGTFPGGAMGGFSLDKSKKASQSALPKVEDTEHREQEQQNPAEQAAAAALEEAEEQEERQRPMTSDTDPYGPGDQEEHLSHHSPLPTPGLGDQQRIKTPFGNVASEAASTPSRLNPIGTPTKTRSDMGFSAFGPSREGSSLGGGGLGSMGLHQQLQNLHLNQQQGIPLHGRSREGSIGGMMAGDNEPLSPTETNPYQSPAPEKADEEDMGNDHMEGGGGLGSVIAGLKRGNGSRIGAEGSDHSGRSSVAGLGGAGLGGFGNLGAASLGGGSLWGGGAAQIGTPGGGIGTSMAPASSFFGGGLGDVSSPGGTLLSGGMGGIGGLGGGFGNGSAFGSASRASRLGQLFPENQQMEEQGGFEPNEPFGAMGSGLGGIGSRRAFGGTTDSPMRERGDVADLFGFPTQRSFGNLGGVAAAQDPMYGRVDSNDPLGLSGQVQQDQLNQQNVATPGPLNSLGQPLRPPPGTLPPAGGAHVMVMPDKIQWVYRDPSGQIQGPFSGLEMHDWYRAGFFQADLAVKRVEDTEFDPLGQLVRKIGNTREPFLVPLPGNQPAGTSTGAAAANWSGTAWLNDIPGSQATTPAVPAPSSQPGAVQPPFAGSFPTFGTTLTAEQQNALERRKQEEQYLMAKQREFLVQQQVLQKQASAMTQLHHQHSAQSLHSQPSFGSLHSPGGFPPVANPATAGTAAIGGQNSFEPGALLRQAGAAAGGSDVLSQQQQQLGGFPGQPQMPGQFSPAQQQQQQETPAQLQQRMAEQQRQSIQRSYQSQQQQQAEKLQRAQEQANAVAQQVQQQRPEYEDGRQEEDQHYDFNAQSNEQSREEQQYLQQQHEEEQMRQQQEQQAHQQHQQSQWEAEPAMRSPAPSQPKVSIPQQTASPAPRQQQSPWAQPAPLVQPFPPAPGSQILQDNAPIAKSPSVDTPSSSSIAPWAKENVVESVKTPSLKEIQELEAKQAAAKDAQEAQARARNMAAQVSQIELPPAPGLPSTATWATSPSTTPQAGGASAWNKPLQKPAVAPVGGPRKTLQQIQKEEEARKAKAAAAAAASSMLTSPNAATSAAGKRYADLAAAKQQTQQMGGGGWTTVGAGGKSKNPAGTPTPTTPGATPAVPTAPRGLGSGVSLAAAASPARKIAVPTAPKAQQQSSREQAQDEFMKWCRASMKDLRATVNPDDVISGLNNFPSDPVIIAETIYTISTTMDGRRFAEEYVKRRAAAQNGVIIEAPALPSNGSGGAGGWNEVAKGRPAGAPGAAPVVPETNAAFKVVAKKGKRRA